MNTTQMIEDNLWISRKIATQLSGKGIRYDELICVGNEALVIAAQKYDPGRGTQFRTYAWTHIRFAMLKEIAKHRKQMFREPLTGTLTIAAEEEGEDEWTVQQIENEHISNDLAICFAAELSLLEVEEADFIDAVLDCLTDAEAEVMALRYGFGGEVIRSQREIGKLLCKRKATVAQYLKAAQEKLAEYIAEQDGNHE